MMSIFPRTGLYAITRTENRSTEQILHDVAAAIRGGAVVIQYRDKRNDVCDDLARQLLFLCRRQRVPLIVNDDIELASRIGADGVHLGREDGRLAEAREVLPESAIIGISCYNSLETALEAESGGATYVAFGRFFASTTKPVAQPAELATLHRARQQLTVPVVAIGGILPDNGGSLLQAGADLLAVIGGIFDSDPEPAAREYRQLFDNRPENAGNG